MLDYRSVRSVRETPLVLVHMASLNRKVYAKLFIANTRSFLLHTYCMRHAQVRRSCNLSEGHRACRRLLFPTTCQVILTLP